MESTHRELSQKPPVSSVTTEGTSAAKNAFSMLFPTIMGCIPFSLRGTVLLVFFSLMLVFGLGNNDIVLTVLCLSILSVALATFLLVALHAIRLRSTIRISLVNVTPVVTSTSAHTSVVSPSATTTTTATTTALRAKEAVRVVFHVANTRVLPLIQLRFTPQFQSNRHTPIPPITVALPGSKEVTIATSHAQFPHRGFWQLRGYRCEVCDVFGLFSLRWTHRHQPKSEGIEQWPVIAVAPAPAISTTLPIISTRSSSGTDVFDLENREGDPLDLKRYHPSDGLGRIVWKIYARTGELVSRHPECTVSHNEVSLFCLGDSRDDVVYDTATTYIQRLVQDHVQFQITGVGSTHCCTSTAQLEDLTLGAAFSGDIGKGPAELATHFTTWAQHHRTPTKIIIVCSLRAVCNEKEAEHLAQAAQVAERAGSTPTFFVCSTPEEYTHYLSQQQSKNISAKNSTTSSFSPTSLVQALTSRWFLGTRIAVPSSLSTHYHRFFQHALSKSWMIYTPIQ